MEKSDYKKLAHYFQNVLKKLDSQVHVCPICESQYIHTEECFIGKALKKKIPVESCVPHITITCKQCGKKRRVPPSHSHINHCSRECFENSLKLDVDQIKRFARLGMTRKTVAEVLEIPYYSLNRKLKKQGLNDLFPRCPHKFNQ